MACSYRIDSEKGRVISVATGVFCDDDLYQHMSALRADPDFREDLDQLMDLNAASKIEVTSAGIHENFERSPFGSGSRRAIVATSDLAFGLARMFQILRDDKRDEIQVFRALEDAARWLDGGKD